MNGATPLRAALDALPAPWPDSLLASIRDRVERSGERLVVLDDDPTGTQTVHGLPVLTAWSADALAEELERSPVCYVLTNSRALDEPGAVALAGEIGGNLAEATGRTGRRVSVASRSDSTLRGHFPAEVDALGEALGGGYTGYIIVPYFAEGGRYTIGDVHYVAQGEDLVPAAETEFAQDPVFGYGASHLGEWVAEKTAGRIPPSAVVGISLDDLRIGGPERALQRLREVPAGGAVVVNATEDRDIEVFVTALLDAEAAGARFLYRTAASFVRVRGGIAVKPLLRGSDVRDRAAGSAGGLVVVGSHVAKSTEQLQHLMETPGVAAVELDVLELLDAVGAATEQRRVVGLVNARLAAGADVVLYTSRTQQTGDDDAATLRIGQTVSSALCAVVSGLTARPRYLIAKGGITSSDVATAGLGVRRAMVVGQLLPGVPVWELGDESKFPGMRYVIFPGNVGFPESVAEAVRIFREA